MRTRPAVAVTCYLDEASWGGWKADAALVHAWYVRALQRAGLRVLLVPPDNCEDDLLDRVDGLVISGGADVDPEHYGQDRHPAVRPAGGDRDVAEIALARRAHERDMPLLGVCRGLQVMTVALGGTLVQHLPDVSSLVHGERSGFFVHHRAEIFAGTLTASIFGAGTAHVNSSHHQSVLDPGPLLVSARAQDGTVEACEDPSRRFFLGVQWHPEHPEHEPGPPLFEALAQAAREHHVRRRRRPSEAAGTG